MSFEYLRLFTGRRNYGTLIKYEMCFSFAEIEVQARLKWKEEVSLQSMQFKI